MSKGRTGAASAAPVRRVPILIVGSGGNAIAVAVLLARAGHADIAIMTKHADFGGAWLQNTYPGCEVDSPSLVYQFEFDPNPRWSSLFVRQPELLDYLRDVARRNDLYQRTMFDTELLDARWSVDERCWMVESTDGPVAAGVLILATGFLEEPVIPEISGMDSFGGRIFHSSLWPDGYTGAGDRVAVVGSGSSAIQIVPALARHAAEVIQFQRTPTWVFPKQNRRLPAEEIDMLERSPAERDARRVAAQDEEERNWSAIFLGLDGAAAKEYEQLSRDYLHEQIAEPGIRTLLTPDHPVGCKRPLVSDDYYGSLHGPNVTLVPSAVASMGPEFVTTADGDRFDVDAVVLATGFHFGGHILDRVRRRDGHTVAARQQGRPRAYKAISVSGCPNLFLVGGAAPNGQIWNGLFPGQAAAPYIIGALAHMRDHGLVALEVDEDAEEGWKADADIILDQGPTVSGGCLNYSQDDTGHNKAAWPGSLESMRDAYAMFDPTDYVAIT
jgi:cation diffusion facilitator CzcD-associated flavoprotein CzcO